MHYGDFGSRAHGTSSTITDGRLQGTVICRLLALYYRMGDNCYAKFISFVMLKMSTLGA